MISKLLLLTFRPAYSHPINFTGITNVIFREADFTVGIKKEASPNGMSISSGQEFILPEPLNYIHFTTLLLSPILTILKNFQNLDQLPHVTYKIYAALNFQYSAAFEVAPENKQKNRCTCVFI